jgi:hypothetical protein
MGVEGARERNKLAHWPDRNGRKETNREIHTPTLTATPDTRNSCTHVVAHSHSRTAVGRDPRPDLGLIYYDQQLPAGRRVRPSIPRSPPINACPWWRRPRTTPPVGDAARHHGCPGEIEQTSGAREWPVGAPPIGRRRGDGGVQLGSGGSVGGAAACRVRETRPHRSRRWVAAAPAMSRLALATASPSPAPHRLLPAGPPGRPIASCHVCSLCSHRSNG